jgi:peptidoglycan hydrolase CwlO-like protein
MSIAPDHSRKRGGRGRAGALVAMLLAALVALGSNAGAQTATEQVAAKQERLGEVREQKADVAASMEGQNQQIDALIGRVSEMRQREAAVEEVLAARQAELDRATAELDRGQAELRAVRERLRAAVEQLEEMLVEVYKRGEPDIVSVVLESESWSELVAESEYLGSLEDSQTDVIERVQTLRAEAEAIVVRLRDARERAEAARDEIAARERELAAAREELEAEEAELVAARRERRQTLAELGEEERSLANDLGEATTPSAPPGGSATIGSDGLAVAPADAPLAVRAAIEAANRIAGLPYVWGGGHGSFEASGYDCSGAVSYALHGGGLIDSPLDSTGLTSWGEPGNGSWITVFANSGHAYAVIAGLRWDTSGTGGSGPGWSSVMRSPAGYVARHPAGL